MMSATITHPADLAALPIGTAIIHDHPLNGVELAVRTTLGWEVTGRTHPLTEGERPDWVGADILCRKTDLLAMAAYCDQLTVTWRTVDLSAPEAAA